jgi:hypothetical protein
MGQALFRQERRICEDGANSAAKGRNCCGEIGGIQTIRRVCGASGTPIRLDPRPTRNTCAAAGNGAAPFSFAHRFDQRLEQQVITRFLPIFPARAKHAVGIGEPLDHALAVTGHR